MSIEAENNANTLLFSESNILCRLLADRDMIIIHKKPFLLQFYKKASVCIKKKGNHVSGKLLNQMFFLLNVKYSEIGMTS